MRGVDCAAFDIGYHFVCEMKMVVDVCEMKLVLI